MINDRAAYSSGRSKACDVIRSLRATHSDDELSGKSVRVFVRDTAGLDEHRPSMRRHHEGVGYAQHGAKPRGHAAERLRSTRTSSSVPTSRRAAVGAKAAKVELSQV